MKHKLLLFILLFLTLGLAAQNVVTSSGPRLYQRSATPQLDAGGGSTGFPNFADVTETNICGLNFVYGSVMTETRSIASGYNTTGTGFPAIVNISGLPTSCVVILHAFLYYDASYTENFAPTTTATITTPSAIVATYTPTMIGTGPAKCWGEKGTATYKADIAASISTTSGNGNYTISLGGFANPGWEVDGCSLIIVYQAGPTAGGTGTFFLFDGSLVQNTSAQDYDGSHGGGTGDSVYGIPVCNNTTSAESFFLIADQTSIPGSNTTNFETGDKVSASFPNNQWNFNIITGASFPTSGGPGDNTTFFPYRNDFPPFGSPPTFDCYNLILFGMYFQNSGCTDCEPVITHSATYPSCNGSNTGSITASVSAGTTPYTYTWSTGATTASLTGLSAGTYTLSVEDIICNTASIIVNITQPVALIGSITNPGISCYGGKNTVTINPSGGTSPYTYAWNNGQTKASATGLTAGSYTVTMKDHSGCSETAAISVTQPIAPVSPTVSANPGVSCYGSTTTATLSISGGTSPYTYSWSPIGGTNATGTGLTVGTYTITITDINGCTPTAASTTVIVTQPATPVSPAISANAGVSCYGGTTSATISTSGGTSPYTYSWSPIGGTNATGTGLTVGTYTITIKDINGCGPTAASTTVIVTQPATPVSPAISANAGVSCYGGTTIVTVTTSGGTSPYTYVWSPIGGTNATGTGLTAGTYTITVTDKNGCSPTAVSTTVIVTQPATPVSPTISANAGISCYGGTSSATISTSGGTSPYTYSWSPIGGTNATGTGLTAGTYTVTIKDINGCAPTAASTTVIVTQPAVPVSPTISANAGVSCYGGTTSATISTSGGTSPYTYSWSPIGGTNATGTGLTAGTYTVTIKDINGCAPTAASTTVIVTQPAVPVSPTISANAGVSCYGGTTSATISTSGGTSPYTYSWSPIGGTNATGTGLTAGTYTITIKDKNGCTPTAASTTIVVTQPVTPVSPTISANAGVSCYGGTTTATVTTSGGTSPYTYLWSPVGGTNATGTGLTVGIYTITIKDKNGCTPTAASTTVIVTQPVTPVSPTISANAGIGCYGGTSSVTISTSGGTSPYTYSWSPIGGTNATGTGLTAGTYTITIKDKNGCTPTAASTTIVVTQPASPVSPTISANAGVSCYGGTTSATISTSGGTSPYTYSWSPIGGTNATGTGLTAGTYTVTIKDINGCGPTAASTTVIVTQPAAPVNPAISANPGVSCYGGTTTATVTTSGGTSPYTYSWSPIGGTNATGTGLTAGTYTITVTDKNGCSPTAASTTVIVTQPATPVSPAISTNAGISCYGGTSSATITSSGGTSPYTYSWSPIGGTNATGTGLTVGTYTITIKDKNGCTPTGATIVVVTQPLAVTSTVISNIGVSCASGNNGSVMITTSGGTSPYTYLWSPAGGTNSSASGLTAGTYTVSVKDNNGCIGTSTVIIVVTQPSSFTATISSNVGISCYGGTASATITTTGGTSPYTYLWSPIGGTNAAATGLTVGTYTITITDKNNCSPTANTIVILTQPAAPVTSTVSANAGVLCYGGKTTATIITSGGTSPYTYVWLPIGGTNATGTGLTAGTYTITVKDKNGCTPTSANLVVIVTEPSAPVSPIISANSGIVCPGGTTSVTITSSGGTSPYTYLWSPIGGTNATGTGLTAGTYTVAIKDANGCTPTAVSTTVVVTQPSPITSTVITSLGIYCNGGTEDVTISTSGGSSPYTYLWSPIGGTNATGTGLTAGTYTVSITDNNGCTGTATSAVITVTQPNLLSTTAYVSTRVSCNGGTGAATVTASGGTPPYTYRWSPTGGTNATETGLTVGTYTITVTDINNCSPTSVTTVIVTQPNAINTSITSTSPNTACIGQNVTLSASGASTYLWSTGSTSSSINVIIKAGDTAYWVIGMTGGCSDTSAITKIKLYQLKMTACCDTKILLGEDTTLFVIGTNMTYLWNDPNSSLNYDTGAIVTATPIVTTTYTVTGTDAKGCTADTVITIEIEIPCFGNLTIPNVFTPTNAGMLGVDNKFYIKTENLDSWSIIIYDRWGVQVYNSTSPFVYWDGSTSSGGKAPAGVYYYMINASCQGHIYKKDGYVQLIR